MEELLRFIELTQKFKAVRRQVILAREDRNENDAEHSFQLAIVGWYIIFSKGLDLDMSKVFKYSLAHDLVEVYAGDVPFNHADHSHKHTKEEEALKQIESEFPEFKDFQEAVSAYEKREDKESRFVYALDKILPVLNIYLDKGHSWKVHDISMEEIIKHKKDKVSLSPEIAKYFEILLNILDKEQKLLFN